MFTTKDTNTAQVKWFAVQDINARAAAAYAANTAFFDSASHQQRVSAVDAILTHMVKYCSAKYETARGATRNRAAHTEVKLQNTVLHQDHTKRKAAALAALTDMGLDLVYKPTTNSFSVHVI